MKLKSALTCIVLVTLGGLSHEAQGARLLGSVEESPFLAAVIDPPEQNIEVWLNPREHWLTSGSLAGHYTEFEQAVVNDVVRRLNLCEAEHSIYELCKQGRTVSDVRRDLEDAGVDLEPTFQTWVDDKVLE